MITVRVQSASLVALFVLMAGCEHVSVGFGGAKAWVERQEQMDLPVAGVHALAVERANGGVHLTAGPEVQRILVTVTKKAGGADDADAEACLEAIEVTSAASGDEQRLGWKWTGMRGASWSAAVSFDVTLPAQMRVTVTTHSGEVRLTGPAGACRLVTHNGPIEIDGTAEPVFAETHSGRIAVKSTAAKIELTSHNGPISVHGGSGELTAETHNGQIVVEGAARRAWLVSHNGPIEVRLAGAEELTAETASGKIEAKGAVAMARLTSKNGPIEVDLASCADLSAETASGRIQAKATATKLALVSHNGAIDAELTGKGELSGRIRSDNGAVTVALSEELSADVECKTANGEISAKSKLSNVTSRRGALSGRLGAGGGKLTVESRNGSIEIR